MYIDKQIHANEIKLRILMTNSCNKNCSFCLNDFQKKGNEFIDIDIAKQCIKSYILYFYKKYPLQIYFSGGEPTLHKGLIELMKFIKSFNRDVKIILNTNGDFSGELENELICYVDEIHFGTYDISVSHAERIKRMKGTIQCIYPFIDEKFIEFYSLYNLKIKIFQNFYNSSKNYLNFVNNVSKKFNNLTFRHTGLQENRGIGCKNCDKKCITLKASWLFPDGGTSPCPQKYKHKLVYLKSENYWNDYFKEVETFHKI